MRVIHSVVLREKPPSKRPRIQSSSHLVWESITFLRAFLQKFIAHTEMSITQSAKTNNIFNANELKDTFMQAYSQAIKLWLSRAIWATSWQNQQNGMCAQRRLRSAWASAQSDQSLLSAWRNIDSLATHWVHSEDSDQTGRMPRLIWVFVGSTCHFVGFVMRRLIFCLITFRLWWK